MVAQLAPQVSPTACTHFSPQRKRDTMSNRASILVALTLVVIAGCQTRKQPAESPSSAAAKPASESTTPSPATAGITDQWLGKWIGPEGTYLVLSKKGDQYV